MVSHVIAFIMLVIISQYDGVTRGKKQRNIHESEWYLSTDAFKEIIPQQLPQKNWRQYVPFLRFFLRKKEDVKIRTEVFNSQIVYEVVNDGTVNEYEEIPGDKFQNMPAPLYPPRLPERNPLKSNLQDSIYEVPASDRSSRISSWV